MKPFTAIVILLLTGSCCLQAQKSTYRFRPFYFALGVDLPQGQFKDAPLTAQTVKANMVNNRFGARSGYVFELGTRFYFNKSSHALRFGLDWTILSCSYHELDWDAYAAAMKSSVTSAYMVSAASRLGPIFSYRVHGKLLLDARFQVAPTFFYSPFDYYKQNAAASESLYFDTDDIAKNFGLRTAAGIGLRWKVLGLSLDYLGGITDMYYRYSTSTETVLPERARIRADALQCKLTLNL